MTLAPSLSRSLERILDTRADPLRILETTAWVVRRAQLVQINPIRIETVARVLALRPIPVPAWNFRFHFFDGTERTLFYMLLLDALNFSFWGEPKWTIARIGPGLDGYWALALALKRAFRRDPRLTDAAYLAEMPPRDLARILRGNVEIPLFVERWRNVQQVGRVLRDHFGGSAARLVEQAQQDAPRLAQTVADHFASFNDTTVYNGHEVRFFKRAQIFVADLHGAFRGERWGRFTNLDALTCFADYKLPQILRAWGVLAYAPLLARRVDRKQELLKDSPAEIEIRAATIWGVELLRDALARFGRVLNSVQMDWFLWESSQGQIKGMKPYHRARTIYY